MEVSCLLENSSVPYLFLVPDSHKIEATTEVSLNLMWSNPKSKIESALECDEKLDSKLWCLVLMTYSLGTFITELDVNLLFCKIHKTQSPLYSCHGDYRKFFHKKSSQE